MSLPREPAPAPPKGYRPKIPLAAQLAAALAQAVCPDCGKPIGRAEAAQRDHRPALSARIWDPAAGDTIPPANDPAGIVWRHIDCHAVHTNGPATKAVATGDITAAAKLKRLAEKQADFRRRVMAKGDQDERPERQPPKRKIPSRPLRGKPKTGDRNG